MNRVRKYSKRTNIIIGLNLHVSRNYIVENNLNYVNNTIVYFLTLPDTRYRKEGINR